MSDFYPYPDAVPARVLTMAIDALRGTIPDKKEAAHAIMHVVSYGLGKWDPDAVGRTKHHTMTPHQAADLLESCCAPARTSKKGADKQEGKGILDNVPWDVLVPLLIAFLKRLIG